MIAYLIPGESLNIKKATRKNSLAWDIFEFLRYCFISADQFCVTIFEFQVAPVFLFLL